MWLLVLKPTAAVTLLTKESYCTVETTDEKVLLMADLMRAVYKKYVEDDEEGIKKLDSLGEMPVYKKL